MASSTEAPSIIEEKMEEGGDSGIASQLSLFIDKDAVVACIVSVCAAPCPNHGFQASYDFLFEVLGKYQEQPMLLSSALPEMVDPLTNKLLFLIREMDTINSSVAASGSDSMPPAPPTAGVGSMFTVPTHAKTIGRTFDEVCKVLQLICRVRGYKHVMKLFPHEVSQLEPCLFLLRSHDRNNFGTWETRYILLLWMCILCLIPFDICRYVFGVFGAGQVWFGFLSSSFVSSSST